jgi:hypothetical protein
MSPRRVCDSEYRLCVEEAVYRGLVIGIGSAVAVIPVLYSGWLAWVVV